MISSTRLPCGAEMLGHRGRQHRAAQPQVGRMVGGHRDDDGALALVAGHVPLDEVGDFARALADQADDDDVGVGAVRDHVDQHRLADARARHDADALADPEGGQRVERAHAGVERHRAPGCDRARRCGRRPTGHSLREWIGPPPSIGSALAIDRAAEECVADRQHARAGLRAGPARRGAAARVSPSSIISVRPLRKPITSADSACRRGHARRGTARRPAPTGR